MKLTKQILNTIKFANEVFYNYGLDTLAGDKELKMDTKESKKIIKDSLKLKDWIKHIETNRGYLKK